MLYISISLLLKPVIETFLGEASSSTPFISINVLAKINLHGKTASRFFQFAFHSGITVQYKAHASSMIRCNFDPDGHAVTYTIKQTLLQFFFAYITFFERKSVRVVELSIVWWSRFRT